jgi:glycosyltransferase involved in cell wall biosynthesis
MSIFIFAPNVNSGGGKVLLEQLIGSLPKTPAASLILDHRIKGLISIPNQISCYWIKPTIFSRLYSEFLLYRLCGGGDMVLCFHGMPPLLSCCSNIFVYQQNRNYLGLNSIRTFSVKTGLRILLERFICSSFHWKVCQYIVQTESMKREILRWKRNSCVKVIPFHAKLEARNKTNEPPSYDFLYVADGEGHKNHKKLFEAWKILSNDGIKKTLYLTLSDRYTELIRDIDSLIKIEDLKIINLGCLTRAELIRVYLKTGALIYPSISESYGLPLIEARQLKVPIIASELDFVRDVCNPIEVFNPDSATSIARAIKRFLCVPESKYEDAPVSKLWEELFLSRYWMGDK